MVVWYDKECCNNSIQCVTSEKAYEERQRFFAIEKKSIKKQGKDIRSLKKIRDCFFVERMIKS